MYLMHRIFISVGALTPKHNRSAPSGKINRLVTLTAPKPAFTIFS